MPPCGNVVYGWGDVNPGSHEIGETLELRLVVGLEGWQVLVGIVASVAAPLATIQGSICPSRAPKDASSRMGAAGWCGLICSLSRCCPSCHYELLVLLFLLLLLLLPGRRRSRAP